MPALGWSSRQVSDDSGDDEEKKEEAQCGDDQVVNSNTYFRDPAVRQALCQQSREVDGIDCHLQIQVLGVKEV